MRYLTEDLIESIKRRTMMPVSQNTFTNADIVDVINEVMLDSVVPEVMAVREDFFLTSEQKAITASVPFVGLPERALGNAFKTIFLVDSSGTLKEFTRGQPEERDKYPNAGEPEVFHFEGDELRLLPLPNVTGWYLEFGYYQRPNDIVLTEDCAKITNVASGGGTTTFTVDTDLTADLAVGSRIDIQSSKSPFLLWAKDVAITAITASTIAVATTSIDNEAGTVEVIANDYICPAQSANRLMLPQELHPWVCQEAGCVFLESLGHLDKLQAAQAKAQKMKASALKLIANRAETHPQPIRKRHGFV